MKALYLVLSIVFLPLLAWCQISGPANPSAYVNTNYSYNDGNLYSIPTWTISTGTIISSSSSGTTYSVTVQWTASGGGVLAFNHHLNHMVDTKSVVVRPLPLTLSGGGYYCSGTSGVTITLTTSENSTSYQLYRNDTISGSPLSGTGSALAWNSITAVGDYKVIATQGSLTETMTGLPYVGVNPSPNPYTVTGGGGYCSGGGGVTLGLSESQSAVSYQLKKNGSNFGSPVSGSTGSALSWTGQTDAGTYTISATAGSGGCVSAMSGSQTITINSNPSAPSVSDNGRWGTGTLTLSGSGTPSGGTYNWYNPSDDSHVTGLTHVTGSLSTNTTNYRYVKAVSSAGCLSSSTWVSIVIEPLPVITTSNNRVVMEDSVTLTAGSGYASYDWRNASNVQKSTTTTMKTNVPGKYTVSVTKSGITGPGIDTIDVVSQMGGVDMNYVISKTVLTKNVTSPEQLLYMPVDSVSQSIQYLDGLGRPMQTVITRGSPAKHDIIQLVVYDALGREAVKYLPYVSGQNGMFKSDFLPREDEDYATTSSPQYQFYQATSRVATDAKPYAETIFEPSPLNRVIKQGAHGTAWQPDGTGSYSSTDRTVKKAYELNGLEEVLYWTFTYPSSGYPLGKVNASDGSTPVYYDSSQLTRTRTKDEEGHQVLEYTDRQGRTVLKRVQAVDSPSSINDTNYASTYYIYDDFGNLVCVVPPEASKRLASEYFDQSDSDKNNFLSRWAFRYAWDGRKRMIQKQVPGAAPVYMVYDQRDRLVMTQDGRQRPAKQWLYTKYDGLNRPVMTGIYTHGSEISQAVMSDLISTEDFFEVYDGSSPHGYTNTVWPTSGISALTITYYDSYSFKSLTSGLDYVNNDFGTQPSEEFQRIKGLATGSKVNIIGTSNYLYSVSYYDDHYRAVQSISQNNKFGMDRTTNLFDFTGKALSAKTTHSTNIIKWKDVVAATVTSNSLTSTYGGTAWGSSGAASVQTLAASTDGWIEVRYTNVGAKYRVMGLSSTNADASYSTVNYGFDFAGTSLYFYENGTMQAVDPVALTEGDIVRIERTGTTVKYYYNGSLKHTSSTSSSSSLLVDAAMYNGGASFENIRTSFTINTSTVLRTFNYDHAGRLLKTWHSINGATPVLLVKNEYNELGQLVDKKLHSTNSGSTFKQSVDHRYNIRGWLTSINNSQLTNTGPNDDTGDLFGMELGYNETIGTSNTAMFNGNISGMKWSRNLALGAVKDVAYNYSYDPMNRITAAAYKKDTIGGWLNASNAYSESGYSYDLNGNIQGLTRKKTGGHDLDLLTYNYGSGSTLSNKLLYVTDGGDDDHGFIDGNTSGNDYDYDVNGNMTQDKNKGINAGGIVYNYLNLPDTVKKSGEGYIKYICDAGGRKLRQELYNTSNILQKASDYAGEYFYENDTLKFINHEEGRVVMTGVTPEYQYNLKDHLGNVRMTFTAKLDAELKTATYEDANATSDQANFLRYTNAKRVLSTLLDRTNGASPGYSERLNGSANEKFGLARSLSVMPGDTIKLKVYAKYLDPDHNNWNTALNTLASQIAGNTSGVVFEGASYATSTSSFPYAGALNTSGSSGSGPKAFLNWLIFDRNFIFKDGGYTRMGTAGKENGTGVAHDSLTGQFVIKEAGYVYVYLSNEEDSGSPVEVYFDDFKVTHVKSPVVQTDDYYPFGLTFNSYKRENSLVNQYQYNSKDLQDELGLGWLDYGARMYQPDLGRWNSLDRQAERMYNWTPYRYAYNNPARFFDTDGMTEEERQKAVEWARQYIKDNQSLKYIQDGVNDCSGYINLVLTASGFPNLKTGEGEFRGAKNGVSQLARNTRQVDILEARDGDILTMWSKRNDHKGAEGEFDHTGIVLKVYADENGNVTGYRIGNFQSSGLREFDYFFDNGDVKKGKGINWVSLRGAYQWDTQDNQKNAKAEKNGKSKDGNVQGQMRGRLRSTLDVLTDSDLLGVWMHQQAMDADKRQGHSNN